MAPTSAPRRWVGAGAALVTLSLAALPGPAVAAVTGGGAAAGLAVANLGRTAGTCALHPIRNSLGGNQFETSCSGGHTRGPEYWCADFVEWLWQHSGLSTAGLSAEAVSFSAYGRANGTQHTDARYAPRPGDAVEFSSTKDAGRTTTWRS